jgi:hypothetical protein
MRMLENQETNRLIDGVIGLVEMIFPGRVQAYYLSQLSNISKMHMRAFWHINARFAVKRASLFVSHGTS